MIEDESGAGAPVFQLELGNRVDARIPVDDTPRLNDALVGDELDVASDNVGAEDTDARRTENSRRVGRSNMACSWQVWSTLNS